MTRNVLELPTLVLNRNWQPVHVTTVLRALVMLWNETAKAVEPALLLARRTTTPRHWDRPGPISGVCSWESSEPPNLADRVQILAPLLLPTWPNGEAPAL